MGNGKISRVQRTVALLLALVMLVLVPAGCGQAPAQPSGKAKEIVIEYWNINNESFGGPSVAKLIEEFNAKNGKGIKVVNKFVPEAYKGLTQNLQAAIASGNYPGVVQMGYNYLNYAAESFPYTSPEDIIAKYFPGDKTYLADNFSANVLDLARVGNGKLVGMPYSLSSPIMYINGDLFRKAGLNPDNPPKTWNEVREAAKIIKEKTGEFGFYLQHAGDNWAQQALLESAGARMIKYENGKASATFYSPEAVKAYSELAELYAAKISPMVTENEGMAAFVGGKIGMMVMTVGRRKFVQDSSKFDLRTTTFPEFTGQKRRVGTGGNMLMIFAKDEEKQKACWEFIKFMYEPSSLTEWTKGTGYLPPRKGVADDPKGLKPFFDENIIMKPALAQMSDAVSWVSWPGSNGLKVEQLLVDTRDAILSGSKTADQALKEAQDKINVMIKQ